jgi:hypothetical protein
VPACVTLERGARIREQRPQVPALREARARRHRRETRDARAAQQREQHGLELIVRVMGGEQRFLRLEHACERGIPGLARGRLQAVTARRVHFYVLDRAVEAERRRLRRAAIRPCAGVGMQPVLDVHDAHATGFEARTQRRDRVHEHTGVEPAAHGEQEAARRRAVEQHRRDRGGFE